jgi:dipeptidyl aminopeptidase/acylaminoacyl peptidase
VKLLALFVLALSLRAQPLTLEQSLSLKTAASPRLSPDARYVAYVVTDTDWAENAFRSQIWIASTTAESEPHQLTRAPKSSRDPRWSPDSRHLAFLSDRDGTRQVYITAAEGGEATQLTHVEGGVEALEWSPDGRRIAFTASKPRAQLWTISTTTPTGPEPLAVSSTFSVGAFQWSPDAQRIAFSATRDPGPASAGTADIYTVSLSTKSVKKIATAPGPDTNPIWSPDASQIAFESSSASEAYLYRNRRIAIVAFAGGRPVTLSPVDENPHLTAWTQQGIFFEAAQKTAAHLFLLDPRTGATQQVSAPQNLELASTSLDAAGTTAAFTCAGPNRYPEICVSPLSPFVPRPLTHLGDQLQSVTKSTRELFHWTAPDGTPLEGILIKPPAFDPSKTYPLLVVLHPGPVAVDRPSLAPDRNYPLELFAAQGAIIFRPNYRGSAGYGEKFRAAAVRNLGILDAQDVSGIDALTALGLVDPARIGAMGWSQGGFLAAFLGVTTRRFKAVSVGAAISDWSTYAAHTDIPSFTRQYLKATPQQDPAIYRKLSPLTYVDTATTPTLLQHGDRDPRVPLLNSSQLYHALKARNVPAKLIVYPGFGHSIDKPKEQLDVMNQNYSWFIQWLWEDKSCECKSSGDTP